jgi:hypothetical protein
MAIGFFDGQKADASPENIKRRREMMARLLSGNSRAPRNIGEGFQAIGNNLAAVIEGAQADREEKQGRATADALIARIMGGGAPMAAVGGAPVASGGAAPRAVAAPEQFAPLFAEKEAKYGLPQGYLARTAQIESNFNPNAKNPNSSATGLFQFINSTARQYGLDNPRDPVAATAAAARLASDNKAHLQRVLGREPTAGELYLAHQQGAGGAAKLLSNPNASASSVVGDAAARLNRGAGMTASAFANQWINKFGMPVVKPGPGAAPMPLARQQAQTAPMPTVGLADMPAPGANPSALEARPVAPVSGDNPQQLMADADYYEKNGNPEAARQMRERAAMAGQGAPAMAQGAPPMAPGGGVAIANNEDDVRFLEARMAAEQGNPQAQMPAPDMPNAQNADNVFSNVPMGLGANQFVERAPFEPAQQGMPNAQNAGDVFSPIPMGLGANPFVQRPPFEQSADQPAPTAQEVAINPARDTVPLPASNVQPEAQPQPRQAPPQLMPMNMGGENGASPLQFIESEFARREGRPDPRMAMGAPIAQAPQMPAGGPPMASDAAPMAQGQPQGGGMNMAALGQFLNSPFVSAENKRMVLAQFEQQRATQQAEAERARTQQANEAAARAAGIDPALLGNPVIAQQAAAARFNNRTENLSATNQAREAEGRRMGLQGPALQQYTLTGQLPNAANNENKIAAETRARETDAARIGLKPGDPRYQTFVLTGKMPREDAQPLSATDKKAILEADESVLAGETAIKALETARQLSPRAMSGFGSSFRAAIGNRLPDMLVPDMIAGKQASQDTAVYENLVMGQALSQLKSIFGAAPTEGEREMLMKLQASVNEPDNVRQQILGNAIELANKRLAFQRQRATELRGGDFYKPEAQRGQGQAQPNQPAQPNAGKVLRYNPKTGALE